MFFGPSPPEEVKYLFAKDSWANYDLSLDRWPLCRPCLPPPGSGPLRPRPTGVSHVHVES